METNDPKHGPDFQKEFKSHLSGAAETFKDLKGGGKFDIGKEFMNAIEVLKLNGKKMLNHKNKLFNGKDNMLENNLKKDALAGPRKLPTVTVAVSAYNEEGNILPFLQSVRSQIEEDYRLDLILIVSDGSTDRTVDLALGSRIANCQVLNYPDRKGKSARFQKIYSDLRSDIIVQLDADVILGNHYVVRDIVRAFNQDDRIMMCGGEAVPMPPVTFTEKAVYRTSAAYSRLKKTVRGGNNIFSVTGCVLAYRREFIQSLEWPADMASDDLYTYLACREKGYGYRYVDSAVVHFRLPQNLGDHVKQSTRFSEIRARLRRLYPQLWRREYKAPRSLVLAIQAGEFLRHPVLCSYVFLLNKYSAIQSRFSGHTIQPAWEISGSTKKLKPAGNFSPNVESSAGKITGWQNGAKSAARSPKNKIVIAGFLVFSALILLLCLRGLPGNPNAGDLDTITWKEDGPFELSPERGRFALLFSIAENKSISFTNELAKFIAPDVGLSPDGRFVSLFAPGVSIIALPGYLAGRILNLAQVGTFAVIAIFAIANAWLVIMIGRTLGAGLAGGIAGAAAFLFATPAFAYSVTLYQHHITTFLILMSLYLLANYRSSGSLSLVWLMIGASIVVDSPNFFLLLPVGLFALARTFGLNLGSAGLQADFSLKRMIAIMAILPPLALLGWYNYGSHGNPFKLSGTLPAVSEVTDQGEVGAFNASEPEVAENTADKQAINFFATRNLLKGFYSHFLSPDRGIIWFAPVILSGVFGLCTLYRRQAGILNVFLLIIGLNILLYSMWGDPYGGWAFGSRYLIPAYALLAVGIAVWISKTRYWLPAALVFSVFFGYSVWVNSLGALTFNMNPPQIEVLALEAKSGKEEKYTYERNWDFLKFEGSKSYVWRTYLRNSISAVAYHRIIYGSIIAFLLMIIFFGRRQDAKNNIKAAAECWRRLRSRLLPP